MAISNKIKEARLKSGLSQEEVCEKISVSRQTLSNWENDKFLPDILSVIKMSKLYKISLDDLLLDEKEIIDKLEKDIKLLKFYKMFYKLGLLLMITGIIVALIFKILDLNNVITNIILCTLILVSTTSLGVVAYVESKKEEDK